MWKTILSILKIIIIFAVFTLIFIWTLETTDSLVSAIGASTFVGMIVAYIMFYDHFRTVEKEATDKKAKILQEKLDTIPTIESPCAVSIHRESSLLGAAMSVNVVLNDFKIGELKNGKTFRFSTYYARNTMKLIYTADRTVIEESFLAEAGGSLRYLFDYRKASLIKY